MSTPSILHHSLFSVIAHFDQRIDLLTRVDIVTSQTQFAFETSLKPIDPPPSADIVENRFIAVVASVTEDRKKLDRIIVISKDGHHSFGVSIIVKVKPPIDPEINQKYIDVLSTDESRVDKINKLAQLLTDNSKESPIIPAEYVKAIGHTGDCDLRDFFTMMSWIEIAAVSRH
jgi:hypothetical protein